MQSYIARAFGDRLAEARAAMEGLAATLPAEERNRVGFRVYEQFRPDVPQGAEGWGAKGESRVERIVGTAGNLADWIEKAAKMDRGVAHRHRCSVIQPSTPRLFAPSCSGRWLAGLVG